MKISYEEQALCVRREIRQREYVYPKLVASGKMIQEKANVEMARMRAVLETVEEYERAELLI